MSDLSHPLRRESDDPVRAIEQKALLQRTRFFRIRMWLTVILAVACLVFFVAIIHHVDARLDRICSAVSCPP